MNPSDSHKPATPQGRPSFGGTGVKTYTKLDCVRFLVERMELSRSEAMAVVETMFAEITAALAQDRDVKLANFGTFSTRQKTARPGRNPRTGRAYEISARRVVAFTPSPRLRDLVAGHGEQRQDSAKKDV